MTTGNPTRTIDCESTTAARESALLAPYAMHSVDSAGRRYPQSVHPYRGPFQRDRDRIVYSAAYRRLSYKTQVFTGEMGDYHRTRLTHTIEVASIARTLGRALRLNEDLIEALALAHDIGHPPFGHAGEDTLDECLREQGGFNHNRQALRIVEILELRYHEFPGLNLSLEVLEGQKTRCDKQAGGPRPLLEVQIVDAADSIAYNTHDADDALELGLLKLDDLLRLPLWSEASRRVSQRWTNLTCDEIRRAVVHELVDWQVSDLLRSIRKRLAAEQINSTGDVRKAGALAVPSSDLAEQKQQFEAFLYDRVYRHTTVMAKRRLAQQSLREMLEHFCRNPDELPEKFRERADTEGRERTACDYLAGMTDRFAQQEHERLFAGY